MDGKKKIKGMEKMPFLQEALPDKDVSLQGVLLSKMHAAPEKQAEENAHLWSSPIPEHQKIEDQIWIRAWIEPL